MAILLVLLAEGIYEVRRSDGLGWHDIYTKFHDDRFRHLSDLTVINSLPTSAVVKKTWIYTSTPQYVFMV
jgi:hypothetical protein